MTRYRIIAGLALCLLGLDQATKRLVIGYLSPHESVEITSFFNLVNVRNYGAAFGFLNDPSSTWQFWLFASGTLIAVLVIAFIARSAPEKDKTLFVALGCILGGALGNFVDRVRFRSVVDFLDFHLAGLHWPAFNVADIAICVGAGLTALLILRHDPAPKDRRPS